MDLDQFLHRHGNALVNTATAVVTHADLVRFLVATGHCARVVDVPVRTGQEAVS